MTGQLRKSLAWLFVTSLAGVGLAGCTGGDASSDARTQTTEGRSGAPAATQSSTDPTSKPASETIRPSELAKLPPIAVVWATAGRATGTGAGNLIVVRGDGTHPREVVAWHSKVWPEGKPYGVYAAHWSPDRKSIGVALAVWLGDPSDQVAIISPKNGTIRRLTEGYDSHFVDWSVDGERMLYTVGQLSSVPPALRSLSVADGKSRTEAKAATRRLRAHDGYDFYPSPDGKWIAAHVDKTNALTITKVTGSKVIALARRGAWGSPIWSSDSRHILFNRDDGVYVTSPESGLERKLPGYSSDRAVGWSPDGSKILFTRTVSDVQKPGKTWDELWVMDADGSRPTRLPFNRNHWAVIDADWDTPHR